MQWKADLVEARKRIWTDYVSDCGIWRCEQGHSVKTEETWALLRRGRWVSSHRTLGEAKAAAESLIEE